MSNTWRLVARENGEIISDVRGTEASPKKIEEALISQIHEGYSPSSMTLSISEAGYSQMRNEFIGEVAHLQGVTLRLWFSSGYMNPNEETKG